MSDSLQNTDDTAKFGADAKPELDNERRYMALLALTAHDLTPKSDELFARLDADPAALESYIRAERGRRKTADGFAERQSLVERIRSWLTVPAVRYAAAFGFAAIVSLVVVTQMDRTRLVDDIEGTYASVSLSPTQAALVLPWERPAASLGFSSSQPSSPASLEYAVGLLRGKNWLQRKDGAVLEPPSSRSNEAALGEWNILLWVAAESGAAYPAAFWRSQQDVHRRLASARYDEDSSESIAAHLARVELQVNALAAEQNSARSARALADELLLFREQFAPHDPASLEQVLDRR
jgi:hypothetical protein